MGGFESLSSIFSGAGQVAAATSGIRKSYGDYRDVTAGYKQAKNNYDENERSLAEKSALDARQLQIEREEATRNRKNTLKRVVAEQQAKFSGQGIDTTDGSGEAALLGLYKESSEQKAYRDRLDQLKQDSLNQDVTSKRRRNLLTLQENYRSARDGFITNFGDYVS